MINLVKSDLYKLLRSKTYKKSLIATICIIIIVLYISLFTESILWITSVTSNDGIHRGFKIGFENFKGFRELIVNALGSGAGIYIIAIVLTISMMFSKKRNGAMKNTVSYGYERWKIYLSQIISLIIAVTILISISFFSILSITSIVFKVSVLNYVNLVYIAKILIIYISIVSATISIYSLISNILYSAEILSGLVVLEILGTTIIGQFLTSRINNFIPFLMLQTLSLYPGSINWTSYFEHTLLINFVAITLGVIVFYKKEIK